MLDASQAELISVIEFISGKRNLHKHDDSNRSNYVQHTSFKTSFKTLTLILISISKENDKEILAKTRHRAIN